MAGAYNDAPSRRMAIDADGTVGVNPKLGDLSPTEMANINSEEDGLEANAGNASWLALIFPELRELDGIFAATDKADPGSIDIGAVDSSADTTNGWDGSWTTQIADYTDTGDNLVYTVFRDNISSLTVSTEKGIKITWTGGQSWVTDAVVAMHIYGRISAGETPDRIIFLDPDNSDAQFTKVLDYGDVPRGQTDVRTIKLKNNSTSKTINSVSITAEDLYLNAGTWYEFGDDDVTYQATFAVGNMTNGATQLIYVKQVIPDAETLGLQTGRIKVSHASVT